MFWRAFSKLISIGDFSDLYSAAGSLLSSLQGVSEITKKFFENNLYIVKFRKFYDTKIYSTTKGIAENVYLDLVDESNVADISNAIESVGLHDKIKKMDEGIHATLTREFDQKSKKAM